METLEMKCNKSQELFLGKVRYYSQKAKMLGPLLIVAHSQDVQKMKRRIIIP